MRLDLFPTVSAGKEGALCHICVCACVCMRRRELCAQHWPGAMPVLVHAHVVLPIPALYLPYSSPDWGHEYVSTRVLRAEMCQNRPHGSAK
ncbi:hypothetical protein C8Q74DRAFT_251 [Fomes fomentarius]|nr:hypothetical protein C8Q74DRAFT_251 [Fomes fomentarius]